MQKVEIKSFASLRRYLEAARGVSWQKDHLINTAKKTQDLGEWTVGWYPPFGTALGGIGMGLTAVDQHHKAVNHNLPIKISVAVKFKPPGPFLANQQTNFAWAGTIIATSNQYEVALLGMCETWP